VPRACWARGWRSPCCSRPGAWPAPSRAATVTRLAYPSPAGAASGEPGSREILEIDGRPAAAVYSSWLGGRLDDRLAAGGSILAETTMHPLATEVGAIHGIPQHLLVHPDAIGAHASLRTFAAVELGDRLELMTGSESLLIERAGAVARDAASRLPQGAGSLAGGVMVYCAGCSLAVGAGMGEVATSIAGGFGSLPYIGCFTFGELGQIVGRNRHGNLMISAVAFGR
jgi:hypothetical protein